MRSGFPCHLKAVRAKKEGASRTNVPRTTPPFQTTNPPNALRIRKHGMSGHKTLGRSAAAATANEMADLK